ncbi:MAG: sulfatase-like hydrolase/transferase [Kiritimatiellales bacterium]|nr:sulfatase-like hydrolase/transferase [Kiritimatiellales bacterium]
MGRLSTFVLLLSFCAVVASGDARRPNILFIVTDDQDFATIGAYGGNVLTPNIDRLAKGGMKCTRGYCTTSSCAPSRYGIMTGRLASRCSSKEFKAVNPPGSQAYITNDAIELEPDRPTLAKVLRAGGYRTGFTGKWHLGPHHNAPIGIKKISKVKKLGEPDVDATLRENQQAISAYFKTLGFDYTAKVYWDNVGEWAGHVEGLDAQNLEWTVQGASDFLDQQTADQPFFFWFAPLQLHNPCAAVQQFAPLVGSERITPAGLLEHIPQVMPPRETIYTRLSAAGIPGQVSQEQACMNNGTDYCLWLDDGVGAVLKKLEEKGLAGNTLVVFFSDNATWGKFHTYERGCNVPLIMRWPGKIQPGSVSDALIANVDFAPTVLAAAGIEPPEDLCTDGVNQLPLLTAGVPVRKDVVLEFGCTRSICDGQLKYIALRPTDEDRVFEKKNGLVAGHWGAREGLERFKGLLGWREWHEKHYPAYYDEDQLYDLSKDPDEQHNLAGNPEYADTLARMKKMLSEKTKGMDRPFGEF